MKILLNEDNFFIGQGVDDERAIEYEGELPQKFTDNHRNLCWKYIDNKLVFQDVRTPEQKEKDRYKKIEEEIPFSIGEELALINKGIADPLNDEYIAYRKIVKNILEKNPKMV